MKSFLLLLVFFIASIMAYSQPKNNQVPMYKNTKAPIEQRVKNLLGRCPQSPAGRQYDGYGRKSEWPIFTPIAERMKNNNAATG